MFQSSLSDGVAFDPFSFQKDGSASTEVDVRPVSGSVGFHGNARDFSAVRVWVPRIGRTVLVFASHIRRTACQPSS